MSGADRRLHRRVSTLGVPATIVGDDGRRRRVDLVDLSRDGVRWREAETFVHRGRRVTVTIRTGRILARPIRLEATIIRRDEVAVAAQFMPVQNRARLDAYMNQRLAAASLPVGGYPNSFDTAAAFRLLGVALDRNAGGARLVSIASSRPGEGKSFVVSGIAASLAAMGRRVLVVDADFYSPTQHLQFVAKGSPGLAQLLAQPTVNTALEIVQATGAGPALVSSGGVGMTPALFSSERIARAFAVLRDLGYPLVIVDCPPLLTSAETLVIARSADDTLLTVRSGSTRERDIRQSIELLQRNGTPAAGLVLNDYKDVMRTLNLPSASTAPQSSRDPYAAAQAAAPATRAAAPEIAASRLVV